MYILTYKDEIIERKSKVIPLIDFNRAKKILQENLPYKL